MTPVLVRTRRTDPRILQDMAVHYSQPGGFVGRNICYTIWYNMVYYGAIVGGSATLHLVGRDEFFGINKDMKKIVLRGIVNNIFYHIERKNDKYPVRNMVPLILQMFRKQIAIDWKNEYNDEVVGFESLIELPRTGESYKRDGWTNVGTTHGYTCKRISGTLSKQTDKWSGSRIWDTDNLRPKLVFVRQVN